MSEKSASKSDSDIEKEESALFGYAVCDRGREYVLHHVFEDERGLMLRHLPIDRSQGVCEHPIQLVV